MRIPFSGERPNSRSLFVMLQCLAVFLCAPLVLCAQTSFIFELLGRHFTLENEFSAAYLLYHPAEDSVSPGALYWQNNDAHLIARNTAHPESLDVYDEESGFGMRVRTPLGLFSGAVARLTTKNTAALPVLADSFAVYTSGTFSNDVDKLLLQYSNRFLCNKIGLVVTLMPLFNEQGGGINGALGNTDCAASLKVRYNFLPKTQALILLLRDYYDKQFSLTMVQIASLGGLFAGEFLGNVVTTHCRSYLTIDKFAAEVRHELCGHWPVFISYEYNAFNTTHAFYLEDMLDVHVKTMGLSLGTEYRANSRLQGTVVYSYGACSGSGSIWYRRSNGYYTPTLDTLRFMANENALTAVSALALDDHHTLSAFFDLRDRRADITDFAYLDPTKYLTLTYGSKEVSGGVRTLCVNAGIGLSAAGRADSLNVRALYINALPGGALHLYDTWTGTSDTLGWNISHVHSLQIDLFNEYRCTRTVSIAAYVSQMIPLYVQRPAPQASEAASGGNVQNISVSSFRSIFGLFGCGITLLYTIRKCE